MSVSPTDAPTQHGSRDRVLAVVRASETPLGVAAITTATGLSANAVGFHLRQRRGCDAAITSTQEPSP